MKYSVDTKSGKKAYLQLYEQLREDIVSGLFPFGKKLPSKRLLAEEVGVSVITVEHALLLLCEEGYVQSRERSGYFSVFRPGEVFSPPVFSPPIPHAKEGSNTDGFPFSVYARVVRKVLSDYGDTLLIKSPNQGCQELRSAISAYLARSRGISVTPQQIVIGSGAEYLYGFLVQLLGRGRLFAIEKPSYEKIEQVYKAYGAKCEGLPLGQDGIERDALLASCANVLHITPYRSFPSGVTASASKKREYLQWAMEKPGRLLVEDDFESEFTLSRKPEETLFSLSEQDNVIYINTFSKTLAPSIRVGYMVLPKSLLALFEEKLGFYSCTVPLLEQMVLSQLLSSGDFERHINRVRRKKRREM